MLALVSKNEKDPEIKIDETNNPETSRTLTTPNGKELTEMFITRTSYWS